MRTAVVGHLTWFENHFPEGWRNDPSMLCLDVDERDFSWLMALRNYRPDITLFFRPELYPEAYLRHISGFRIAILSEPLPALQNGRLHLTAESALRLDVYQQMAWGAYDWRIYYDPGRAETAEKLGFQIDEFRPMPIDTECFRPPSPTVARPIDVCFIGKATPHRIAVLDFMRLSRLRFLWVAHGLSGRRLAWLFRRSRIALNVHADGVPAMEPRLYLAAACGCRVVTEPLSSPVLAFRRRIIEECRPWTEEVLQEHVRANEAQPWNLQDEREHSGLSTRRLLSEAVARFRSAPLSSVGVYT